MLNAIITANDQTAIIEFPIDQFDLYKQLGQIGVRKGPHKIHLTDDEDAEIQVKLYADNDFGNHVIRLFHERDTLDDVHTAVGAIDIASDDVKEQLEEYILHDQLEGTGHLYNTIREIKEAMVRGSWQTSSDWRRYRPHAHNRGHRRSYTTPESLENRKPGQQSRWYAVR